MTAIIAKETMNDITEQELKYMTLLSKCEVDSSDFRANKEPSKAARVEISSAKKDTKKPPKRTSTWSRVAGKFRRIGPNVKGMYVRIKRRRTFRLKKKLSKSAAMNLEEDEKPERPKREETLSIANDALCPQLQLTLSLSSLEEFKETPKKFYEGIPPLSDDEDEPEPEKKESKRRSLTQGVKHVIFKRRHSDIPEPEEKPAPLPASPPPMLLVISLNEGHSPKNEVREYDFSKTSSFYERPDSEKSASLDSLVPQYENSGKKLVDTLVPLEETEKVDETEELPECTVNISQDETEEPEVEHVEITYEVPLGNYSPESTLSSPGGSFPEEEENEPRFTFHNLSEAVAPEAAEAEEPASSAYSDEGEAEPEQFEKPKVETDHYSQNSYFTSKSYVSEGSLATVLASRQALTLSVGKQDSEATLSDGEAQVEAPKSERMNSFGKIEFPEPQEEKPGKVGSQVLQRMRLLEENRERKMTAWETERARLLTKSIRDRYSQLEQNRE